ncbi:hypothetical protein GCM10010234_23070 [Streptomyces hawaiiensis]
MEASLEPFRYETVSYRNSLTEILRGWRIPGFGAAATRRPDEGPPRTRAPGFGPPGRNSQGLP